MGLGTGLLMGMLIFGGSDNQITGPGGNTFIELYSDRDCIKKALVSTGSITSVRPGYKNKTVIYTYKSVFFICRPYATIISEARKRQAELNKKEQK